jgi:hypothetical protein
VRRPRTSRCRPSRAQAKPMSARVDRCSLTLLELVWLIQVSAHSDAEVVAILKELVNTGSVVLAGTFAGARIP